MGTVKYSGPVASFHCPTEATIRSLKVHFSPKQLGEGDPSPENVREIEGWDGVEVYHSGKNLFDASKLPATVKNYYTEQDGYLYINHNYGLGWINQPTCLFLQPGTYTASLKKISGTANESAELRSAEGGWVWESWGVYARPTKTYTDKRNMAIRINGEGNTVGLQVELGDSATSYEPYHGETVEYEFGVLGKNKFDGEYPGIKNSTDLTYRSIYVGNQIITASSNMPKTAEHQWSNLFILPGQVTSGAATGANDFNADVSRTITPIDGWVTIAYRNEEGVDPRNYQVQLELGSTATAYEPYDPNKMVYGGWVDLISGEVQEEYACLKLDENIPLALAYNSRQNASTRFYTSTGNVFNGAKHNLNKDCYVNIAKQGAVFDAEIIRWFRQGATEFNIYLPNSLTGIISEDSDQVLYDKAHEYLSVHNIDYVFTLQTPLTYFLAPTELQTFLGQNNIWSNADYVEVEYDLHETQTILAHKQFIIANQPHVETLAAAPLQNFVTDMAAPLKECKVHFEPKQDLHGYDKPWVGGSGKNLFNANDWWQDNGGITVVNENKITCGVVSYVENKNRYTLPSQNVYVLSFHAKTLSNASGLAYVNIRARTEEDLTVSSSKITLGDVGNEQDILLSIPDTAYYFQFNDWAYNGTVELSNIQLEKGSTATSYEPYENICPISGWTEFEVYHTGKNLMKNNGRSYTNDDTTWTVNADGSVRVVQNTSTAHKWWTANSDGYWAMLKKDITYTLQGGRSIAPLYLVGKDDDGTTWSEVRIGGPDTGSGRTFTLQQNAMARYQIVASKDRSIDTIVYPMLTFENVTNDYEPYNGTTIPITFPSEAGTVYGGYIDLTKKELIQTSYNMMVDENTAINISGDRHGTYRIVYTLPYLGANKNALMCDKFGLRNRNSAMYNYPTKGLIALGDYDTNTTNLQIGAPSEITTQEQWLNWLTENGPIQVIYELAEPFHYSLTTETLKTLHGTNNIWSNANGNIELSYWKH